MINYKDIRLSDMEKYKIGYNVDINKKLISSIEFGDILGNINTSISLLSIKELKLLYIKVNKKYLELENMNVQNLREKMRRYKLSNLLNIIKILISNK